MSLRIVLPVIICLFALNWAVVLPMPAFGLEMMQGELDSDRNFPELAQEPEIGPPREFPEQVDDIRDSQTQDTIVREKSFSVGPVNQAPEPKRMFRKGTSYYIGLVLIVIGGGSFIFGMLARRHEKKREGKRPDA